ncbi:MAG: hypothetical protein ACFHU9_12495 [Fluviicola sp.]
MKTLTLFTLIFVGFVAHAQFEIDSFIYEDEYDFESKFPIIRSSENPKAAERVNIVLHHRMLEKMYKEDDQNRFENVFPPEGEFHGASEFEFDILANNERYFSVAITCAYTGAYTEYSTNYFNFDAKTGQPVQLSDLFGVSAIYDLSEWVSGAIHAEITAFMKTIDTNDPEGYGAAEQFEMYAECAEWYSETQTLSNDYYYLTDTSIVFVRGRCSNHMMAALDDLWEFHEEYALNEVHSMMSPDGIALMAGELLRYKDLDVPEGKIIQGQIGDKYPITMLLSYSYDNYYNGIYWYDKVKQPIQLSGKQEHGYLHLTEEVSGKSTGSFDLRVINGGMLEGEWKNTDGSKTFDIKLSIPK